MNAFQITDVRGLAFNDPRRLDVVVEDSSVREWSELGHVTHEKPTRHSKSGHSKWVPNITTNQIARGFCIFLVSTFVLLAFLTQGYFQDELSRKNRVQGGAPFVSANVSLLVPCTVNHFKRIPEMIEAIKAQTVQPYETVLSMSIDADKSEAVPMDDITRQAAELQTPFKVFVRGGTYRAGDNRAFLLAKAEGDVISWFDCDDYMHPQRTEIIDRVFKKFPELDAVVHPFVFHARKNWDKTKRDKLIEKKVSERAIRRWKPIWPYKTLWNADPITRLWGNRAWDVNDTLSEPNHVANGADHWWFPLGMGLKGTKAVANGWLSARRETALSIPYPKDLKMGEDSLYNWRIIKSHKNFSMLPWVLGAYIWGDGPVMQPSD